MQKQFQYINITAISDFRHHYSNTLIIQYLKSANIDIKLEIYKKERYQASKVLHQNYSRSNHQNTLFSKQ